MHAWVCTGLRAASQAVRASVSNTLQRVSVASTRAGRGSSRGQRTAKVSPDACVAVPSPNDEGATHGDHQGVHVVGLQDHTHDMQDDVDSSTSGGKAMAGC